MNRLMMTRRKMTKTMNLKCGVSHYRILRYCFQKSYESSAGREYRSNVNFMEKSGYLAMWYLYMHICKKRGNTTELGTLALY